MIKPGAERDVSLFPNTHVGKPTTTCNSSSRRPDDLLWPLQATVLTGTYSVDTETETYI